MRGPSQRDKFDKLRMEMNEVWNKWLSGGDFDERALGAIYQQMCSELEIIPGRVSGTEKARLGALRVWATRSAQERRRITAPATARSPLTKKGAKRG